MKALITGGAGFIGGHLAESLIAGGHSVVAVDDLSTGFLGNLEQVENAPGFTFVQADITDQKCGLAKLVADCDMVFHLAAAVGVELVVHDPVRTIRTNVHGTEAVLDACARFDKRVIVASTSEVYGKSEGDFFNEDDDLLIGCPTHSRWSYACSKLLDEFYVMAFRKAFGLRGTVVRFFNTVGPRQTGQYGMVIPRFVSRAVGGEALDVYGDGSQTRCFCHVLDVVRALRLLADNPASYGEIYNIGGQRSVSMLELAHLVRQRVGSASEIRLIPYEQAYEAGFEDMMHRAPDTDKIRKLVGWSPRLSLEQIIDDVALSLHAKSK